MIEPFASSECGGIERVLGAVESAVGFLLLAADHDIDLAVVQRRRDITDTELDAAHSSPGVAHDAEGARAALLLHRRGQRFQGCFGNDKAM